MWDAGQEISSTCLLAFDPKLTVYASPPHCVAAKKNWDFLVISGINDIYDEEFSRQL